MVAKIKELFKRIKAYSKPDPNAPKLTTKQLQEKFKKENESEKLLLKSLHGKQKVKEWLKWFFVFPIKWCWVNLRDPKILIIFLIWYAVLSSEVWFSYLMALITIGTPNSAWWLGIANVCWAWWLIPDPLSQFMLYVITLTIATKAVMDKIRRRK